MTDYPIRAYLSYRCKLQRDVDARNKLNAICGERGIELIYDEVEAKDGDSLIKFMDDLTSARFVFLFLSPEYFQSAYTLFELVKTSESQEIDESFVLPLRLMEAMVTYQWTGAKTYFDEHEAVRNELARLLKIEDQQQKALWQRIDDAWHKLIFPYLDHLHYALENQDQDKMLGDKIAETRRAIQKKIDEATSILQQTVVQKISYLLNMARISLPALRQELALMAQDEIPVIAKTLVMDTEVGDAIALLTRVLEEQGNLLDRKAMEWKACFHDTEQICGWLLINSVDPVWWFHNQVRLDKSAKNGITCGFELDDKAYVEVIISRNLLQNAQYTLDRKNQPKPAREQQNVLLFDVISPGAKSQQLLRDLYQDLYNNPAEIPTSEKELLAGIVQRAHAITKKQRNKPVYYLVNKEDLSLLSDCVADVQIALREKLQFICCEKPSDSGKRQACREDQTLLLNQLAYLISLGS